MAGRSILYLSCFLGVEIWTQPLLPVSRLSALSLSLWWLGSRIARFFTALVVVRAGLLRTPRSSRAEAIAEILLHSASDRAQWRLQIQVEKASSQRDGEPVGS